MRILTRGSPMQRFLHFMNTERGKDNLNYESQEHLHQAQEAYSSISLQYVLILTAASCIGSLGLMADSSVTIVGAMLLAPAMKPIMAISYSLAVTDKYLFIRALITLVLSIVMIIGIAYMVESELGFNNVTSEILLRTSPNLMDLGVAIAAGIASALASTRKSVADSLPGVAIAVALVPPLCVTGICIAMQTWDAFVGSLLLFGINLFAIILCASVVFLLSGYGVWKKAYLSILVTLVILFSFSSPLNDSMKRLSYQDVAQDTVQDWLRDHFPDQVDIHPGDLNLLDVSVLPDHVFVYMELAGGANSLSPAQLHDMHHALEQHLQHRVRMKIQMMLVREFFVYPDEKNGEKRREYGVDALLPRLR